MNKFVVDRSYAAPKAAARELVEIANATERLQHGQGRRAEGKFSTAGHVSVAPHLSGVAPCATGPLMAAR